MLTMDAFNLIKDYLHGGNNLPKLFCAFFYSKKSNKKVCIFQSSAWQRPGGNKKPHMHDMKGPFVCWAHEAGYYVPARPEA